MKYSHKQILVLSLFVFSATNYCMEEDLKLKPYEPNTIENIKKQRKIFIKNLFHIIDFNYDKSQLILNFCDVYLNNNCIKCMPDPNILFNGHSLLSPLIVSPYFTEKEKIIQDYARHKFTPNIQPTPRDLQFAQLELYERRYKLKDTIMFWCKMHPHIEETAQQLFPHEIMQHIGMLMLNTEKSLL